MRRGMSSLVYARTERLHPGLLDRMVAGGAEVIEIFASRGHFNYSDRQHVREIANWFRSTGTTFHSLHAPMHGDDEFGRTGAAQLNIAAVEKRDRIAAMDEIKRAIEVAEHAPFQFLVQHVGVGGESSSGQKIEAAMTSLEHLRAFAKPLGVQVVVENIPNDLSTPEGLVELLHTAHFTDVGVCLDVGHAHMAPGVIHAFETLKDLIRTTHIHDNHGERDEHLWPGNGTIEWEETIESLRSSPHVPALVLEIEGVEDENVPEKMTESYKKLDA
ncbi:MAG TPA: sugar phosphate isomerase/epimerase family protein, partial [Terriglobales bacterium]